MKLKLLILFILLLFITACSSNSFTRSEDIMGTAVTITVYDNNEGSEEKVDSAFSEIRSIDSLMSTYKNTSQLSILNRNKEIEDASPDLLKVINDSLYYSKISEGAFDISVKPLLDLYSTSFKEQGKPPTQGEIQEAMQLLSYRSISINNKSIKFTKPNMQITLGAIAKGYAVDKAIYSLKEQNIDNALVNAGGDIYALGTKKDQKWRIALQNPRNPSQYITILYITDKAVTTSGDYERYFDENKSAHHILNPKTGRSATDCISVTVIADTAEKADALSTTIFVLGPEKGLALVESLDDVESLIIDKDRNIIKSSGLGEYELRSD